MSSSLNTVLSLSLLVFMQLFWEGLSNTNECTTSNPVVLGCTNTEPPINFKVTYPTVGEMNCEDILSIDQAGQEPTVSIRTEDGMTNEEVYYTLLLVDTTPNSPVHPILHYGASNIPSSSIVDTELVLSSVNPFSNYRGPAPPAIFQKQSFNYEWILAEQESFVSELSFSSSNINFDYISYLEDVNSEILTTQYFSSGFCIKETPVTMEPTAMPTMAPTMGPTTASPVSSPPTNSNPPCRSYSSRRSCEDTPSCAWFSRISGCRPCSIIPARNLCLSKQSCTWDFVNDQCY